VYSGLVVYAARLKWQGLVVNPRFATYGVGIVGMLGIQSMLGPGGFILWAIFGSYVIIF
jgi:hypothetical protein